MDDRQNSKPLTGAQNSGQFAGLKRLLLPVLFLIVFVCSTFAASAALILWLRFITTGYQTEPGFLLRLVTKGVLFTLLAAASARGMAWASAATSKAPPEPGPKPPLNHSKPRQASAILLVALAMAAALVLPRIEAYPWAAPDELHHLIVARNLAEHHAYASGHPQSELRYFDHYDSVGPPLIGTVAAAFSVAGTQLATARVTVAFSFLLFCLLIYKFCEPIFGPTAAALAVIMATMSFGSIYLARTLYGEVPAFMFFMAGLLLWRQAWQSNTGRRAAFASGVLFGLAALTKTFIFVSAFAFAGALLYDRLTYRSLKWRHVAFPALGLIAIYTLWPAFQFFYRDRVTEDVSLLIYYQHSLMFGLDSAPVGLAWILKQPISLLVATGAMLLLVPAIFHRQYDPPMIVLFLTALLFLFWWVFFTNGQIPRYMWYSCVVTGMFSGLLIETARHGMMNRRMQPLARAAWLTVLTAALATGLLRTSDATYKVYAYDEMADDVALADYLKSLPPETTIATTYWPVQRSANFLANRVISVADSLEAAAQDYDIVIMHAPSQAICLPGFKASRRAGRYVIVSPTL